MPRRPVGFTAWLLVVTLTAAGAAAAAGYALTAPKRYRATAQLLVSPVSAADPTFAGLDVFRDVPGKPAAAQSAAVLVRSPQVADAVRAQLGVRRSRDSLLGDVHAHVVGSSSVVDVTVEESSAASAAQLANAFVDALIAQRTAGFQSQLTSAIRRDGDLLGGNAGAQKTELARRLAVLRSFQGQPDPTLRRAATATAPSSASWPQLGELLLIGAGIGLAAGAACWLLLVLFRRGPAVGDAEYSRGMSDRALQALVDRLEQRLAARESALAARERDLQAKIDELQAIAAGPAPADDTDLRRREAELQERVAAVTRRELAVARAAASAAVDEDLHGREQELARREQSLAERVAAVTQRELAVARLAAREPQAPAAPAPAEVPGAFDLARLERLVAERGPAHPGRLDEWESTLFFLRDYAGPDGTVPGTFDWLIEDTFAPLLD
jgi:subunit length determinant Wzz-like protein